jgi:hypothetical protein
MVNGRLMHVNPKLHTMFPPRDIDLTILFLNNHNEFKCSKNFGNVRFVWFENNIFNEIKLKFFITWAPH